MKKCCIVDGSNCLFRAFYAIPSLSTSKGFPTNALYGLAQMLLALKRQEAPDYFVVVFDTVEPTFRDELYADYKANRKAPPDDLVPQFPYVRRVVEALGIPVLERPGFEADDVIGTLAKKLTPADVEVVIVSGDKDLMQLVNDPSAGSGRSRVTIVDTMKGIRIGEAEVRQRFGVPPAQVVEVLGLMGDSSDNIPGIPGVGEKTAIKLIQEHGSVEQVIARSASLKGALADKVLQHVDLARLSRRLVEIHCDMELGVQFEDFAVAPIDPLKARPLFQELEFTKLLGELAPAVTIPREGYRLLLDRTDFDQLLCRAQEQGAIALDLETTSLNLREAEIVGISFAVAGFAGYAPCGHRLELGERQLPRDELLGFVVSLFERTAVTIVGHNLKYDLQILQRYRIAREKNFFDTMIASYLLNPSSEHGLKALAAVHFGHTAIAYQELVGKGKTFQDVPLEQAKEYAAQDADIAFRLFRKFRQALSGALEALFFELEMPLLRVLMAMEQHGMLIEPRLLAELKGEFTAKLAALEKKIYDLAGGPLNINSPKQLGEILFGKLQLPGGKKNKTGFSTSQSVLDELALHHPLPKLILEYRSFAKLISTYIDALPALIDRQTGRIHTSFNQTVAATGRLSSSDPNLQNIPIRSEEGRRIRQAFIAPPGFLLIDCDYSQIELRVLAHLADEPALIQAFRNHQDVHRITAASIFGGPDADVTAAQRAIGKVVNFSTIYGQSAYNLAKQLGLDAAEAQAYIQRYFQTYPRILEYREQILQRAREQKCVTTLFGRIRPVPDILHPSFPVRAAAERAAFNAVFQGTAADIIKRAMVTIHQQLPQISARAALLLQVHDELIFEVPEPEVDAVKTFVVAEMANAASLSVPLVVDVGVGRNWAEAH